VSLAGLINEYLGQSSVTLLKLPWISGVQDDETAKANRAWNQLREFLCGAGAGMFCFSRGFWFIITWNVPG
jgi:hypothetical protein